LGRRLAGRAVGLVLSGGGARGFAHLGVLRAIDECGVVIDAIGGNSMGSIVAGLFACGFAHDERVALCRRGFAENPPDGDYTLPMVALHAGKRGNRMLRTFYGDVRIEDLWMDYFSVSTNLTRAEMSVARDGPMWRWVRASSSPPGIAPPLIDNGDLHVDGGILDNLPVGVMRRTIGIGTTIASDAGTARVLSGDANVDDISGWEVLLSRWRRGRTAANLPTIADILMRTATISSIPAGAEARRSADLYLQPPSDGVRISEWSGIDRAVQAGYEYALPVIDAWKNAVSSRGA
jgi:predicted acylesterase/phospholipase RssA